MLFEARESPEGEEIGGALEDVLGACGELKMCQYQAYLNNCNNAYFYLASHFVRPSVCLEGRNHWDVEYSEESLNQ